MSAYNGVMEEKLGTVTKECSVTFALRILWRKIPHLLNSRRIKVL